jgi:hypothetical protein
MQISLGTLHLNRQSYIFLFLLNSTFVLIILCTPKRTQSEGPGNKCLGLKWLGGDHREKNLKGLDHHKYLFEGL